MNKPRPILIIHVSVANLPYEQQYQVVQQSLESVKHAVADDEYIVFCLPTKKKEHKVELLNPNIVNDEDMQVYLAKLNEIQKILKTFFKNNHNHEQ